MPAKVQGCRKQSEAYVGYMPLRATREMPLYRSPFTDESFDTVKFDAKLGWQSEPNPEMRQRPPMRQPINDRIPVYQQAGGDFGWVDQDGVRVETCDEARARWADGPLPRNVPRIDFQVPPPGCPADECGLPPIPKEKKERLEGKAVRFFKRKKVKAQALRGRLTQRGTETWWLEHGAVVKRIWKGWRGHYTCIEVVQSRWAPAGERMWVESVWLT